MPFSPSRGIPVRGTRACVANHADGNPKQEVALPQSLVVTKMTGCGEGRVHKEDILHTSRRSLAQKRAQKNTRKVEKSRQAGNPKSTITSLGSSLRKLWRKVTTSVTRPEKLNFLLFNKRRKLLYPLFVNDSNPADLPAQPPANPTEIPDVAVAGNTPLHQPAELLLILARAVELDRTRCSPYADARC